MQIAIKVLNQLAWLAKDGETIQVQVHQAEPDVMALAAAVLERVPEAWSPYEHGGGYLECILVMPGGREASWCVHRVPQPDAWVKPPEWRAVWERAGLALAEIAAESMISTFARKAS